MVANDKLAEDSVRRAIEELVSRGERAYSHSVPVKAVEILISMERHQMTTSEAMPRISAAIASLSDRKEIEAPPEPRKDWLILDLNRSNTTSSAFLNSNQEEGFSNMASRDKLAEDAVIEAIEELIAENKRAYSHSVPLKAVQILVSRGRGRVARGDATERVRGAIVSLHEREAIEASHLPRNDWLILDYDTSDSRTDNEEEWDLFICHASEDKDSFVRPLAERLEENGVKVWYDEFTLKLGDSLRQSIDNGLVNSRYGVVVLSQAFFRKDWPQWELDGLVVREVAEGKVVLPIWHQITAEEIRQYSPSLAGKVAVNSDLGLDDVVSKILEALE